MAQRDSPHLSSHSNLQNGSAPSSPSMSNAQQAGSYPSPSLSNPNPNYQYPPPNNQQSEPYRASPTGSNISGSNMSLPSMRTLDPAQAPMNPAMNQPYYGGQLPHPSHYASVTSDPNQMRYALPATDARVMSGGRHKKEIKRRTKTGCLTCRKRRIKVSTSRSNSGDFFDLMDCDEQHPACRNCQKSKRDCLGYDPIFKQQPGPPNIQPAPSSAPSQAGSAATANPYGNQSQILGGYGAPVSMAYDPALSAGVSSPGSAVDSMPTFRDDLKRALQSASPFPVTSDTPHLRGGASSFSPSSSFFENTAAYTTFPAKRSIEQLLTLGAPPIPGLRGGDFSQGSPLLEEAKHLYYSIYAPGLEGFLESKWFPSENGVKRLTTDRAVLDKFGLLLAHFAKTSHTADPKQIAVTSSVEARLVWGLATMVQQAATAEGAANGIKSETKGPVVPPTDDATEAANRLTVFENLLTGRVATSNRLTAPVQGSTDHHRLRELEFWYTLGNFVCLRDDDPSEAKAIDDTTGALRNLLDGRENRDVLYSIAIVRALGHRVSEYTDSDAPLHFDESDNKSKLAVAKKFINDEGTGGGTTNVIRRLCELATRSWTAVPTPAAPPAAAPVPVTKSD
ncbi:putative transcriptional regulatory protein [Lachnellula hyalina]|uniref:Putative transcriptional regulatory protein n=1 Tax=Lachnellula hyalina TaxID=1316788 RepID=A0A8H8QZP3_9HELO|nr:putative transcriptional regulatory protein [Lachnellula hyalina]TVY25813.1 putative transcriptional regulatory protein [Lachnellula hyalina]